ncbi:MAG: heparinase II/III family protein [Chthoniobacteraceae bacterium]
MENLFRDHFAENDLAQILAASPLRQPLPAAGAKSWNAIAQNPLALQWMPTLRSHAEAEIGEPLPVLSNADYRDFHATGNRLHFESIYFERRSRLGRAALCALLDKGNPAWLDSVKQKMREIMEEFSWALPAHVNSPSGKDSMHIDLSAAETANLMAELITAFGPVLGADLIADVRMRLHIQFFENYVNRHEDLHWTLTPGNWNAVCHRGVIGAALSVEEDLVMIGRMLMLAKKYLPVFLSGYGNDGACSEGPDYWQYGFGWFCMLNEHLEVRTNGQLSLIEGDPKIPRVARYGPLASLHNFHFVNFSDSQRSGYLNPFLLAYLGERLRDEYFNAHAMVNYQYLLANGIGADSQRADFFHLTRLFLRCPADLSQEVSLQYEDVFFKDLAVAITHGHDSKGNFWDFAAKAGTNNEHHNHNDCGSFIVNINGMPMIVEIGTPEYTKDYFRERRYEHLAARTLGHSLPIVNGYEQSAGPHYFAKVLNADLEPDRVHFCVDLTRCYPLEAGCVEIVRDFLWDKNRGVLQVKDYYELTKHESFESSIITDRKVTIKGDEARLEADGCMLVITLSRDTVFVEVEEHEYRDHSGLDRKVKRIILGPSSVEKHRFIGYEITVA